MPITHLGERQVKSRFGMQVWNWWNGLSRCINLGARLESIRSRVKGRTAECHILRQSQQWEVWKEDSLRRKQESMGSWRPTEVRVFELHGPQLWSRIQCGGDLRVNGRWGRNSLCGKFILKVCLVWKVNKESRQLPGIWGPGKFFFFFLVLILNRRV